MRETKMKWYEMMWKWITEWKWGDFKCLKKMNMEIWHLITRHWKHSEKQTTICEWCKVNNGWTWLMRWKNQMPGQYHETVQKENKTIRRKWVMEEKGFKFFLWKLQAERAKDEVLKILNKLREYIGRPTRPTPHRQFTLCCELVFMAEMAAASAWRNR